MKLKLKTYIIPHIFKLLLVMLFTTLIVFCPSVCIKSATDGLNTCLKIILPSLFPFTVISKYLILSGYGVKLAQFLPFISKLFNLPSGGSFAFLSGIICGSPVGASCICDMVEKKQLSRAQAEHMLGFCNNSGPLFLIGTVGTLLFSDKKIGYLICLVHVASAFIVGILLRSRAPSDTYLKTAVVAKKDSFPFITAVNESVNTMLGIFGFVIIFSVICGFFTSFSPVKSDLLNALFCGFLEISCGCIYISELHMPVAARLCFISLVCGFSGLCILFQTMHIIKKTGLDIKSCLKTKVLFSFVSFLICFIFCSVLSLFNVTFL